MDYLDMTNVIYSGEKQNNEPHGQGVMKFPDGQKYTGQFECGQFHGDGQLEFVEGKIIGKWDHGRLLEYEIFFSDGLKFEEQKWDYIIPSDRRYYNEVVHRVPVAASRETPAQFPDEASIKTTKHE